MFNFFKKPQPKPVLTNNVSTHEIQSRELTEALIFIREFNQGHHTGDIQTLIGMNNIVINHLSTAIQSMGNEELKPEYANSTNLVHKLDDIINEMPYVSMDNPSATANDFMMTTLNAILKT